MKWHLCYVVLLIIHVLISQGQVITVTPEQEYSVSESLIDFLDICISIQANDNSDTFTIDVTTNSINNQATVNQDYLAVGFSFTPRDIGLICVPFIIILNDALHEPTEFINLTLSSTNMDVAFNGSNVIVEILDDDDLEILDPLPLSSDNITEGGDSIQICYNITTGNPNNISLMLSFNVSDIGTDAVENSDFRLVDSAVNGSIFCYDLRPLDDDVFEPLYETINFTVSSSNPLVSVQGGYQAITIIDNELLAVNLLNTSAVTIMEGQSEQLCFQISLNKPIATSTAFTLDTSSSIGDLISTDNVTITPSWPPEFMIAGCITIIAVIDSIPEGEKTYTVTWINSDNRTDPVHLTNIVIIVGHLTPSLVNETSVMVTEGQSFMVCVELNGVATKQNNFSYTVISGIANNGDYTPSCGVVSIEPDYMIDCSTIQLVNNAEVEGTRNFTISFTDSSIDSMIVNIIDDDVGCVGFSQSMVTLDESVGVYLIQLISTCDTITAGFNISVTYGNGTAIAGSDFNYMVMNPLYWTMSTPPSITVNILDNDIVDGNRTFNLSLSVMAPSGLNINTLISQLQLMITNDDQSTINTPARVTYQSIGEQELCFNHTNQLTSSIQYTLSYRAMADGSAMAGVDFTLPDGNVFLPTQPSNLTCITLNLMNGNMMNRLTMFKILWMVDSSDILLRHMETTVTLDISFPIPSTSILTMPRSQLPTATTQSTGTPTTNSSASSYPTVIGITLGVVLLCVILLLVLVGVIWWRIKVQKFRTHSITSHTTIINMQPYHLTPKN